MQVPATTSKEIVRKAVAATILRPLSNWSVDLIRCPGWRQNSVDLSLRPTSRRWMAPTSVSPIFQQALQESKTGLLHLASARLPATLGTHQVSGRESAI